MKREEKGTENANVALKIPSGVVWGNMNETIKPGQIQNWPCGCKTVKREKVRIEGSQLGTS